MRNNRSAWVLACILALTFVIPGATSTNSEEREIVEEILEISDFKEVSSDEIDIDGMIFSDLRDGTERFTGTAPTGAVSPINIDNGLGVNHFGLESQEPTRASDTEREQDAHDFGNGSRISSTGEPITGSLTYDPDGTSDFADWYKISQADVDPSPNAALGPRNISITLTSFLDGNDGHDDLYEYRVVETSPDVFELESDYYDYLQVHVKYYDPSMDILEMGGTDFLYDDLDPSDSWEHAGNWSFNFKTPVPSTGPEDNDGFTDGLEEVGWYYIRLSFNFRQSINAPAREGYSINYQFEVDTDTREPTDAGANTIETAGQTSSTQFEYLHTFYEQVDWYQYVGSDWDKLWKMNISIERTWGSAAVVPDFEGATTGRLYDSWMHVWIVFPSPGDDGIWDNDDDGWYLGAHVAFTYLITGNGLISDSRYYNVTITDPGVDNPERGAFIGTYIEPVTAGYEDTTITDYFYNYWYTYAKYKINVLEIIEESVNQAPSVSDLTVSSNNEFYDDSGDVVDEFRFEVTYSDPDGDEPENLDLYLDHGESGEQMFSMLEHHDGAEIRDGRTYWLILDGNDIGDKAGPYSLMVNASDKIPETSMRWSLETDHLYLNNTLKVWDDRKVELSSVIDPIDPIQEDSDMILVGMESYSGGPFNDAERKLRGVLVWNQTDEKYTGDSSTDLLHVNMTYRSGDGWYAQIIPKENMNGEEIISFYGYDDHSHVIYNYTVTVFSVNDPPRVTGFTFNGKEITIDDRDPLDVEVDLRDESIKEDIEFTFRIIAEDTDPDEDDSDIVFSYLDRSTKSWSSIPEIGSLTGDLTYTPTNSDVRTNGLMVFRIEDESDFVEVKVRLDVDNSPDDPELKLEPKGPSAVQDETWSLLSAAVDIDPMEDFVFSTNIDEEIGLDIESIRDQLSDAEFGVDYLWSFEADTGKITFQAIGDNVWKNGDQLLEQVMIQIVVRVTDKDLRTDIKMVNLTLLKNGPWIPDVPEISYSVKDEDPNTVGDQGLEVTFTAEEYDSAYGDWTYTWILGPGVTMTGDEVIYTYETDGIKNIRFSLVKGEYVSEEKMLQFTLEYVVVDDDDDDDDIEKNETTSPLVFIGIGAVVVIILIIIVIIFLRKREPPVADQQYEENVDYERNRMSLGPGPQTERLSPSSSLGERNLPPARGGGGPAGLSCPSCGAAIQKDWFLCPECKNTLKW